MRDTIFISHATPEDNEFTIWLASRLELMGYKVWIDKNELLGGESFWEDIEKAITEKAVKFLLALSDLDKATIDKRNDYLHGRNPLELSKQFELTQISLRLHSLIVALFLKYVGYEGHLINLDIHIYLTDEDKMIELARAEQLAATAIIEAIEKAKAERDRDRFEALKAELGQHIANNKFNNLIRII